MRLLLLLLAAAFPATAQACAVPANQTHLLHERLPRLPGPNVIAAEVVIGGGIWSATESKTEARIVRMIQGRYRGRSLWIDLSRMSSCDVQPQAGQRGFLVGYILSSANGTLLIQAIPGPPHLETVQPRSGRRPAGR